MVATAGAYTTDTTYSAAVDRYERSQLAIYIYIYISDVNDVYVKRLIHTRKTGSWTWVLRTSLVTLKKKCNKHIPLIR